MLRRLRVSARRQSSRERFFVRRMGSANPSRTRSLGWRADLRESFPLVSSRSDVKLIELLRKRRGRPRWRFFSINSSLESPCCISLFVNRHDCCVSILYRRVLDGVVILEEFVKVTVAEGELLASRGTRLIVVSSGGGVEIEQQTTRTSQRGRHHRGYKLQ